MPVSLKTREALEAVEVRRCKKCGVVKLLDCFKNQLDSKTGRRHRQHTCRDCANKEYKKWITPEYRKEWREKHLDHARKRDRERSQRIRDENGGVTDSERNANLKANYGITLQEYEELSALQGHVCAICRKLCRTGMRLAVDHCHRTGAVRGLLCSFCNRSIGGMMDDPELLRRAADYLEGKL